MQVLEGGEYKNEQEVFEYDNFLSFGVLSTGPDFGDRYCEVSESVRIPYYGAGVYFGEFSTQTKQPHGRGIFVSQDGWIYLNFFEEGVDTDGKYINISTKDGYF